MLDRYWECICLFLQDDKVYYSDNIVNICAKRKRLIKWLSYYSWGFNNLP